MLKRKSKKIKEFIPKNYKKYTGTYPIRILSEWERLFCQYCDLTPTILEWSSESIAIPYFDPVKGHKRRYYPDFKVKILNKDNSIDKYIIEIKPDRETRQPKMAGKKSRKTQKTQELTYLTNCAKWKAASNYCNKMGLKFKIITEKTLFTEYKK